MRSLPVKAALFVYLYAIAVTADDQLVEPTSKDNSAQCQCYLTSGPDPGYFQHHRFWDFRNIPSDGDNDYTVAPALVTDSQNNGDEPVTSAYFNTSRFLTDWAIQTGQQGQDRIVQPYNSAQNVYISRNSTEGLNNSTYLTLRAHRLANFMSIAEIDSKQMNLLHSSIRVRTRVIPNGLSNSSAPSAGTPLLNNAETGSNESHPVDGGAVFGFFTYHNDQQESDIEILTNDPTDQIHYSNQPDYNTDTDTTVPGASTQFTLPDNLVWTEWAEHRIDSFDGIARWYLNDQLVENKSKNAIADHNGLIMNLWGDGDTWSGNMSVGGQVTVAIEWIDMVFNVSGNVDGSGSRKRDTRGQLWKRKDTSCQIACDVDGVQTVGYPEVSYNVSSSATSFFRQGSNGIVLTFSMTLLTAALVVIA